LEANAFQTRAVVESMKLDSKVDLKHLKVDGGMTNGNVAMEVLADIGGFTVIRPDMREYVRFDSRLFSCMLTTLYTNQINCAWISAARWLCYSLIWLGYHEF
jgi:glycerol kinase